MAQLISTGKLHVLEQLLKKWKYGKQIVIVVINSANVSSVSSNQDLMNSFSLSESPADPTPPEEPEPAEEPQPVGQPLAIASTSKDIPSVVHVPDEPSELLITNYSPNVKKH